MKKLTCLTLCLILILSLFSACSKPETPASEASPAPDATKATEADVQVAEANTEAETDIESPDDTGVPVVDSFNAFITVKAEVFGKMQEAIGSDPNSLNMMMGLLEPAVMDLEMIPISFLISPESATYLGNKSCIIEGDDRDFKIAIVNSKDENMISSGTYDTAQDRLSYNVAINNAPTSQIDYAQDKNGTYVSQYYVYSTKHTIRMVFNKMDFAIGITTDEAPPASFDKSMPKVDFDYAKNDVFYLLYKDGKIAESVSKQ